MKNTLAVGIIAIIVIAAVAGYYGYTQLYPPSKGTLNVGTNVPFPPFEYTAPNGTIVGFDISTISALARSAGYTNIQVTNMEFDSLIPALQQGKVDVVAAGMTITPDREKLVNFTNPYWNADQSILVTSSSTFNPQSMTDLSGKTVGVQTGTTGESLAEEYNTTVSIRHYDTFLLAVLDLVNGRIDAVVVDSPVATAFTALYPVKVSTTIVTGEVWGFAVKAGNSELLNSLNQAMATFKGSTQWNNLLKEYFGTNETS
jgi:polar amino acid transport system substrate-binding protein